MNAAQTLQSLDYWVFALYFFIVASYGLFVFFKKKPNQQDSKDYFLAEGSLTWWAIGASLIASNISAEQFIGMSGAGFKLGLAVASYEWLAAITLIVIAVYFLPLYLKNKIYTMPHFLSIRYNNTVATLMAVFWLLLYVVVNLTSILFLGALAVSSVSGIDFQMCMAGLAVFSLFITLGGMKVIGYTDVIQVVFLVAGGLVAVCLALEQVASAFGMSGVVQGFQLLTENAPAHFHMILKPEHEGYLDLPGLSVVLGGMWVGHFSYWGCNQYITQRALGADLKTARNGLLFAAFIKLFMPLIVILPGIAAFMLHEKGVLGNAMLGAEGATVPDRAYPVILSALPVGLKGLSFAALTAAIVASLAGKTNSIATIFTFDIYQKIFNKNASEETLVKVGKWTVLLALLIAFLIAPFLGIDKGGLTYIQEYTGFVSPGIFAMFLMGFFYKRATANAAMFATLGGFLFSVFLKFLPHQVSLESWATLGFSKLNAEGVFEIPFFDRMAMVFVFCILGMMLVSKLDQVRGVTPKTLERSAGEHVVGTSFWVGSTLVIGAIVALYMRFW